MLLTLLPLEGYWMQVKDGDSRVAQLYMRHYSCHQYQDKRRQQYGYRNRFLVMGPGEKLVLLSVDGGTFVDGLVTHWSWRERV